MCLMVCYHLSSYSLGRGRYEVLDIKKLCSERVHCLVREVFTVARRVEARCFFDLQTVGKQSTGDVTHPQTRNTRLKETEPTCLVTLPKIICPWCC